MSKQDLLTENELALKWWEGLGSMAELEMIHKHYGLNYGRTELTMGMILEIWQKETANTGKEKSQDDIFTNVEWDAFKVSDGWVVKEKGLMEKGFSDRIAELWEYPNQIEANAKLIASAPQLYRENKEMKELLQRIADYDVSGDDYKGKLLSVSTLAATTLFKLNNK